MPTPDAGPLTRLLACAALLLAAASCGHDATSPTASTSRLAPASASNAKSQSGPAVSSTNPGYGNQGTTLDVHVLGSGFGTDAQATWLLNGNADAHVHTNKTTFVSSTEVVANITIASDAQIALWDVSVATGGKNGVGSDAFAVTTAHVLSTTPITWVEATNNLGDITGYMTYNGDAFVYDDAVGFVNLGPWQGWALDPDATIAFGKDGTSNAIEWALQPGGTWTHTLLPAAPNSVGRFATSAARMADGTLLVAGVDGIAAPKNNTNNRPVVWHWDGSTWSAPTVYAYPAGITRAFARTVNATGEVGGQVEGSATGAIWDNPTTSVQVDGWPNAINSAGTIAVGQKTIGNNDVVPVYWWRDPVTQAWHTTGVLLPTIAGANCNFGDARGMNDALVIVGESCNSGGKNQATVWHLDFSGSSPVVVGAPVALSSLSTNGPSPISTAVGISQTAPYVVGGSATSNGSILLVRWYVSQ